MTRIRIDASRVTGVVDRKIFSGFVEHLGRCIYGGLYDPTSDYADEFGFRTDVGEAIKDLNPPVLRWPGGNFVSNYHWTDGVGPVEQRPVRMELAWHLTESNLIGTDEFLQWCARSGYEPYLCVNMGSGTFEEAQAWVEYCNSPVGTYWADLRAQNGHPEPYGVKLWALGNEMYGDYQVGQLTADEYVAKARAFAKVMKRTDGSLRLISCGRNGHSEWDRTVLEGLADLVEFHSIHIYTGSPNYWVNVFAPHQADRALRSMRALIDDITYRKGLDHEIKVAYDEWNVWYRYTEGVFEPSDQPPLEERYDLELVVRFIVLHSRGPEQLSQAALRDLNQVLDREAVALATKSPRGSTQLEATFVKTFDTIVANGGDAVFRRWDSGKKAFVGSFLNTAYEIIALGLGYHVAAGTQHLPAGGADERHHAALRGGPVQRTGGPGGGTRRDRRAGRPPRSPAAGGRRHDPVAAALGRGA